MVGFLQGAAIAPTGLAATAGDGGRIILWDVSGRRQIGAPLRWSASGVRALAFTPDGSRLAAIDVDGELRVWMLEPKALVERARRIANGPPPE